MTNPNDPAFVGIVDNTLQYVPGLTKREYFAGLALNCLQAEYDTVSIDCKSVAKKAVRLADALIAELNKGTK